jgi:hypothetical protein
MQEVEDFMRELLGTRIAEEKAILANRAPYRKRFFTPDCRWDNRQFTLEMIESEQVVSVERSGSEAVVITEYTSSIFPPSARTKRRRYHLIDENDSYLICAVEDQCPYCKGQGDAGCVGCEGKHWL